jgi:monofunctional biosynthetic peptidoglycan transglycosylase
LLRALARAALVLALVPIGLIVVYRFVPPPGTPLMLIRFAEGYGISKRWEPLDRISPNLVRAVMASEDARFCRHWGFDFVEMENAFEDWQDGERLRGASTITQQTAKNLFLWPGRNLVRKALETALTPVLELLWSKPRIIEVYLNVVEWGPGIYGAEAAARAYFGKPARELSRREATLLAAILPNPRRWSASRPTPYIERRAATISARMTQLPRTHPVCG